MKKLVLLFSACFLLSNCSKDDPGTFSENSIAFDDENIFQKAGYLHNEGLDFVKNKLQNSNKKFKNENFKSSDYVFSRQDSILILKTVNDYVIEYMLQDEILNELEVSSDFIMQNCKFSDDELLNLFSNDQKSSKYYSKNYNKLLGKINNNVIDNKTLAWIENQENILIQEYSENKNTQTQIDLVSYSVGKYSTEYFINETKNFEFKDAGVGAGTVGADVSGAVSGGIAGSVAGPVGTVAVGTAGALIGSSTAYMTELIWDEIW